MSSFGVPGCHSRTTVTTPSPMLSTGKSRNMLPGDHPRTTTPYSRTKLTTTPSSRPPRSRVTFICSGGDDHRDDHRAAPVRTGHPAADRAAHELLEPVLVVDPVHQRRTQLVDQLLTYVVEDVVVLHETTRVDVEGYDPLRMQVDHGDDRDEAL